MLITVLLVVHIAVLGYWLGSELVINSTYRYVAYGRHIPFAERNRLMEHVMHVDQHVRYALVLQAGLGFGLATLYGMIPGGEPLAWAIRKGDQDTLNWFNNYLRQIKGDGSYDRLYKKWFESNAWLNQLK